MIRPRHDSQTPSDSGPYGGAGFSDTPAVDFEPRPWDSPGRRRLRQNRAITREGQVIDGRAEAVEWDADPAVAFTAGDRVFHQKFGYGHVAAVDGQRLVIDFEKSGTKKVIGSFLRPA